MKVYIVIGDTGFDSSDILDVFLKAEDAEQFVKDRYPNNDAVMKDAYAYHVHIEEREVIE